MAKYLIQGNYLGEGIKGLLKEGGSSRRAAIEGLANSLGGSVEAVYYAFGDTDIFVIMDMPDHASVTAAALMASASGAVAVKTTVLMTPEEVDEAAKKTPSYRPPGQ
ncbi:MAG: GYD domain-containing protein [Gammaproteobacteria bacterium]|nr:MAG: GYD domain-containing protein [Gammaproteobacteria bacterium]